MSDDKFHDYESIYSEIRSSLMRFAGRYFKRPHDVEDVVQEAFVKVLEATKSRSIDTPKSYIYQTAKNLALKEISKNVNKLTDLVGDFAEEDISLYGPSLEQEYESREQLSLVLEAVRELPPKCQRAFVLKRIYGYSQKEIAEEMGISVNTVEIHLTRAILHCTEFMKRVNSEGENR